MFWAPTRGTLPGNRRQITQKLRKPDGYKELRIAQQILRQKTFRFSCHPPGRSFCQSKKLYGFPGGLINLSPSLIDEMTFVPAESATDRITRLLPSPVTEIQSLRFTFDDSRLEGMKLSISHISGALPKSDLLIPVIGNGPIGGSVECSDDSFE